MTVAIPLGKNLRLVIGAELYRLGERRMAVHSNIIPDKLADETDHILMVDFDDKIEGRHLTIEDVRERVDSLGLYGWAYPTEKGWHFISPVRMSFRRMLANQLEVGDDIMHCRMSARFGRAALALHPPREVHVIGSPPPYDEMSKDHYAFYRLYFDFPDTMERADTDLHRLLLREYRKQKVRRLL